MSRFIFLVRWLVVLALPILVTLSAARIMVAEWYPRYEYAKPDFPPDPYGFTQAQRVELATACIRYLGRPEPAEVAIPMLRALRLPGADKPLFAENEISHMLDVKRFTDLLWRVQVAAAVIVIGGLAFLLGRRSSRREGYAVLFRGGLLTTGLLAFLVAFVLLSWRAFFVAFHEAFFPPDTWTFDWSDSLIRLFPDRFWFDAGVLLTAGALAAGAALAAVGYALRRWAK